MAYDEQTLLSTLSAPAASDMTVKQFFAVSLASDGAGAVSAALATQNKACTGILKNNPYTGAVAEIQTEGITKAAITASTAITAGQLLKVDTGGTLCVKDASNTVVAQALESLSSVAAVAIIAVRLLPSNAALA